MVEAQAIRGAALLKAGGQPVLGESRVLKGVGEEQVKEPALHPRRSWGGGLAPQAGLKAPPPGDGGEVDQDHQEDGEEHPDSDGGEVGIMEVLVWDKDHQ